MLPARRMKRNVTGSHRRPPSGSIENRGRMASVDLGHSTEPVDVPYDETNPDVKSLLRK
jgi:hypothetical protein